MGPRTRRPPRRGRGQPHGTDVVPACAGGHDRHPRRPDDVHIYAFDGAAGALSALVQLPHTGAVVTRDETARGDRLVARLVEETGRRQRLLARHGFGSVVEQRRAATDSARGSATGAAVGPALPYLVVLVDGWEGLCTGWETRDHGRPVDALLRVLGEGEAVGIRAVITGDRSVLLSRIGAVVSEKLVLRMPDATDLLMAGIDSASVPLHQPPGRALRVSDSVEMQLALLDGAADGPSQAAALNLAAARARSLAQSTAVGSPDVGAGSAGSRPFRVDPLPALVPLSRLRDGGASPRTRQVNDDGSCERRRRIVVGVGGDHLEPVGCDRLGQGANALVAGPARSGRSTALRTLVVQLVEAGRPVVVLTARPSRLAGRRAPDPPGVGYPPSRRHSRCWAPPTRTTWPPSPARTPTWWPWSTTPSSSGQPCRGPARRHRPRSRAHRRRGALCRSDHRAGGHVPRDHGGGAQAATGDPAQPCWLRRRQPVRHQGAPGRGCASGRGLFVDGGEPIAIQVAVPT